MRKGTALLAGILGVLLPAVPGFAAGDSDHGQALVQHYRLEKPDGAGPWPAVVMVSGCSGFEAGFAKAHYDGIQRRLVELGFLAVRVDYLAVRDAQNCTSVPTEQVARDIAWVVADLRQNPAVKPDAINLLGWSWGGAGVLRALAPGSEREPVWVAAVVAYYPACTYVQPWDSAVPVLSLNGTLDDVARPRICKDLYGRLAPSTHVTMRMLAGARHAFDVAQLPAEYHYAFGTLGSNPQAAAKAWSATVTFLRR
jgi:dienelactone hydrolase